MVVFEAIHFMGNGNHGTIDVGVAKLIQQGLLFGHLTRIFFESGEEGPEAEPEAEDEERKGSREIRSCG